GRKPRVRGRNMANLDRAILFKQIDRLYRDGTFTSQSDGQLVDRYLSYRDEGAFEAIVNLHGPIPEIARERGPTPDADGPVPRRVPAPDAGNPPLPPN